MIQVSLPEEVISGEGLERVDVGASEFSEILALAEILALSVVGEPEDEAGVDAR